MLASCVIFFLFYILLFIVFPVRTVFFITIQLFFLALLGLNLFLFFDVIMALAEYSKIISEKNILIQKFSVELNIYIDNYHKLIYLKENKNNDSLSQIFDYISIIF